MRHRLLLFYNIEAISISKIKITKTHIFYMRAMYQVVREQVTKLYSTFNLSRIRFTLVKFLNAEKLVTYLRNYENDVRLNSGF